MPKIENKIRGGFGFTARPVEVLMTMGITHRVPAATELEILDSAGDRTWAKFYIDGGNIYGWVNSKDILIDTTHLLDDLVEFNSPI